MPWRGLACVFGSALLAVIDPRPVLGAEWVRAGMNTNLPIWGLRHGLQFAIPPGGFTSGDGGPRGLIRIGYPTLPGGAYDLVNFIAIEPIVNRRRGFSELEASAADGRQGKWIRAGDVTNAGPHLIPGTVRAGADGIEELTVPIAVERFANGAHVRLVLSQRSNSPDELRLLVESRPDSAPIEQCILTATMGNKARTRLLWLNDEVISSLDLYPNYRGRDFTEHRFFPLSRLHRAVNGDAVVAITTDEEAPASQVTGLAAFWRYRGAKVTQYWRKPAGGIQGELQCAVNARYTYWMSTNPIPGGVAFENFELVEPFRDGKEVIFGITRQAPADLLK